ncbi:MAG: RluA family pseudouridine synthase [Parcubacteria group bacterium]|nr:RluA family pseudouridine synthase [Parcubacteria group bacterium]
MANSYSLMEIPIVYEDEHLLAVNKPAGLLVHPSSGKGVGETVISWIEKHYPGLKDVGEPLTLSDGTVVSRPGIVHRLDKDTSGILLIAKSQKTYLELKRQFQEREVEKEYRAVVYGTMEHKEGVIDAPIARDKKDYRRRKVAVGGREAKTLYTTLATTDAYSYVSLFPKTGRTHQLRVHLKSIDHPVVCDPLYAPRRECPAEVGRLALHAFGLSITHPDGTRMRLEAPLPGELERFIQSQFPRLQSNT